jgi:hypothetical protein
MTNKKEITTTGDCTPEGGSGFTIQLGAEMVETLEEFAQKKRVLPVGPNRPKTAEIAEQMRRVIERLVMPTAAAAAKMTQLGIEMKTAEDKFRELEPYRVHGAAAGQMMREEMIRLAKQRANEKIIRDGLTLRADPVGEKFEPMHIHDPCHDGTFSFDSVCVRKKPIPNGPDGRPLARHKRNERRPVNSNGNKKRKRRR